MATEATDDDDDDDDVSDSPAVTTVIPGIKDTKQAKPNFQAGTLASLGLNELAKIDAIVPQGGGRKIWPA